MLTKKTYDNSKNITFGFKFNTFVADINIYQFQLRIDTRKILYDTNLRYCFLKSSSILRHLNEFFLGNYKRYIFEPYEKSLEVKICETFLVKLKIIPKESFYAIVLIVVKRLFMIMCNYASGIAIFITGYKSFPEQLEPKTNERKVLCKILRHLDIDWQMKSCKRKSKWHPTLDLLQKLNP